MKSAMRMLILLIINLLLFIKPREVYAKIFDRCELARVLLYQYSIPVQHVSVWVCIAQHQSGFNTSALLQHSDGGYHGMYQISDVFWCSPWGEGNACNINCARLRDEHLYDDFLCMNQIYNEHQKISGDGYNAWTVYKQYCNYGKSEQYVSDCFGENDIVPPKNNFGGYQAYQSLNYYARTESYSNSIVQTESVYKKKTGKVYERCELARELLYRHQIPMNEIANWVCIAYHESNFNTSAIGRLNSDGSGDHGIFQISDIYWCSPPGKGWVCGLSCAQLEDDDISDDVKCMKKIYDEHNRISGDGFNAWSVYQPYCLGHSSQFIDGCFSESDQNEIYKNYVATSAVTQSYYTPTKSHKKVKPTGKVYDRCELARELKYVHNFPDDQIATWVCIVQHESSFNVSAVGRFNTDGSGDHGLFQISDIYWCSPPGKAWACGLTCSELEDNDISDDVACVKKIYEEHTKISGDGFNAWTVYPRYCKDDANKYINGCFDDGVIKTNKPTTYTPVTKQITKPVRPSKIYDRCELAQELKFLYNFPDDQIATWVCIVQHESSYNTSAVRRLNADGSGDHGLFQISDIYWCSPPGKGWACGLTCSELEDGDISNDVECVKKIHEEHTRISGDGFNAWTMYPRYCKKHADKYLDGCFNDGVINTNKPTTYVPVTRPIQKVISPGKVYDRCELARELKYVYSFPDDQISTLVCIAKYESSYNTSAVASGSHGLFQISDAYWCSPPGTGYACGLTCSALEDGDITDDIECVRHIYEEYARISGDGFNAWSVYQRFCKNGAHKYTDGCFSDGELVTYKPSAYVPVTKPVPKIRKPGKMYERCELARELKYIHNFPDDQIATWVCIVHHESNFNTSIVGHSNGGGSGNHGLFQISDIYWCSPPNKGWACDLTCSELEDGDITDDVECVRKIYEEHTRISGNGFNAWTVYSRYCKDQVQTYIEGCFDANAINTYTSSTYITSSNAVLTPSQQPKVYDRCELALELKYIYNVPDEQLATWVCIAQHESNFNTSAIGRLNYDGSGDHGLFQISDIFWCSPPGKGYACGLTCSQLEDNDIRDDVECARKIYEEHTRISGDGFNAWTVYALYCKDQVDTYIADCFTESTYRSNQEQTYYTSSYQNQQITSTSAAQQYYPNNPFLGSTQSSFIPTTPSTFTNIQYSSTAVGYSNFNQYNTQATSTLKASSAAKTTLQNNVFLNGFFQSVTQKPITKPPVTTYQNSFFTAPQTYSTYHSSYQPPAQSQSLTHPKTTGAYTTSKPGFYNFYTQQASTKNVVSTKPDMLTATTTKPTTTKQTIQSKVTASKTKSTTIQPTTKPFTFKPFVFLSATAKPTTSTTKSISTSKSSFQFPPFTTRTTTRTPFISNNFFTQTSRKAPHLTTTTTRPTPIKSLTLSTTKLTNIKPTTTTRGSILDRFTTFTLKPTTKKFKYGSYFTSSTTSRTTTKATLKPFRLSLPASNTKFTTKSKIDSFTTKFTTPRTKISTVSGTTTKPTKPRTTRLTTTPKTTTLFDFDAFFSRKPSATQSPRTIRATVPLTTVDRSLPSTPESSPRPTISSTTRSTTQSNARPSTQSTPRPITSTLSSPFETTKRKSLSKTRTTIGTTPRPPLTTTTTSKTTSSITLSRSTFNNNNLNITKIPTKPSITKKASPFDLWFDRLKH